MTAPGSAHVVAVSAILAMFEQSFGSRWRGASAEVWSEILEDAKPEELLAAGKAWCKRNEWPPTPAELLKTIPGFCRCRRCVACNERAITAHKQALERGAVGHSADPADIEASESRRLAERQRAITQQAAQLRLQEHQR